jgi:predicted permease
MNPFRTLRAGARALLRRPLYATLVALTLAVGTGGTTAVFALVDGVLLDPLPYEEPDRLVTLDVISASTGFGISLSIPHYMDWRDRSRVFSHFGASVGWNLVRQAPEGAERLSTRLVLGDFFELLGLDMAEGRPLSAAETDAGAAPLAVLGHAFRARAFDPDAEVVGRSITLDGVPHTVVGVLEPGQGYPSPAVEVYAPMGARSESLPWSARGSSFGTRALARLAPGVSVAEAQADMDRVVRDVTTDTPDHAVTARVRTVRDLLLGDVTRGLWILMGGVVLVLLIAGANVANLALARTEARSAELRLRSALGAGAGDLAGLLIVETFWLSLVGGAAGVALAYLLVGALPALLPVEIPAVVAGRVVVDASVLLFALAVTTAAGAAFGLAPAVRSALSSSAVAPTSRSTEDRTSRRFREALVTAQVALSVVLLVSAGLLMRSLGALATVDKGFDESDVFTARLVAPGDDLDEAAAWLGFHEAVIERLEASPHVERAAATLLMPLSGSSWEVRARAEAGPVELDERPSVLYNVVSESYFDVLDVPLRRGRSFEPDDHAQAPLVAIVDETMAARFWPGADAIGRQISVRDTDEGPEWRTVVGVSANVRHYTLAEPSRPQVYLPLRQAGTTTGTNLRIAAKVRGDAAPVVGLLRQTVTELAPSIPVVTPRMLDEYVADAVGGTRAMGFVTSGFAVLAALLASLGIFGVLTLMVTRRGRELGVRMAVGAAPRDVVKLIVGQAGRLVVVGMVLGVAVAAAGSRTLESFLYEVQPVEWRVYAVTLAVLAIAAALAITPPALRATRVAPGRVLQKP